MFNQLKKQLFSGQSDASNHSGNFLIIFQDIRFDTRISKKNRKRNSMYYFEEHVILYVAEFTVSTSSIQNKLKFIVLKEYS